MEKWLAKLLAAFILFLTVIIFGFIPNFIIKSVKKTQKRGHSTKIHFLIGCFSSFGGGVFLGTAMLHLLPEVREQINEVIIKMYLPEKFASAEFTVTVGFFLVMILEHTLMKCLAFQKTGLISERPSNVNARTPLLTKSSSTPKYSSVEFQSPKDASKTLLPSSILEGAPSQDANKPCSAAPQGHEEGMAYPPRHQHHLVGELRSLRALLLFVALSFHTVFEGVAVGLAAKQTDVWQLCLAICIHKSVISLSLGLQLSKHNSTCRLFLLLLLFAIICPVGVGVGAAVKGMTGASLGSLAAQGILQGLATGTFLYVTFFEVLQKEIENGQSLVKVLFAIIGFGLMTVINLFGPDA